MTEAIRLALATRAVWMGDEEFVPVPKVGLVNKDYIATRSVLTNPVARTAPYTASNSLPFDATMTGDMKSNLGESKVEEERPSHSTHYLVVYEWGNVVSITTTIKST